MTTEDLKKKSVDARELALIELVATLAVSEYKEAHAKEVSKKVNDCFRGLDIPKFCHTDPWVMSPLKEFTEKLGACISKMHAIITE